MIISDWEEKEKGGVKREVVRTNFLGGNVYELRSGRDHNEY